MSLFYCDITKVNEEERIVEGYFSTDTIDSQGDIVTRDAIADAIEDYMKFGNIREMHQPSAVGKALEISEPEYGKWYMVAKVVDDSAWNKVKETVYNGFSIGGKSLSKINGIISKLRLTEISLVDRPANPEAVFNLWKGDSMADEKVETVEEAKAEQPVEKGMYSVAWLADIIGQLNILQEDTEWEKEWEGDNSTIPDELKAQIKALGATLTAMVAEEIAEIVGEVEQPMEYADKIDDIEKAGASISKTNRGYLENIIELCNKMIGESETEKADTETDLNKGEDLNKSFDDLQKAFDDQKAEMTKMAARIKELEAIPAPSKIETAIAKGDEESDLIDMENLSVHEMIKMAHAGKLK